MNATLADLLGIARKIVEVGKIKIILKPFTLRQFEDVKKIILEVIDLGQITKSFASADGNTVTYRDTEFMTGFLKSPDAVPRFLALCAEIEMPGDYQGQPVTIDDIPLNNLIHVLKEVLADNQDFFRGCLELVCDVLGQVTEAQHKIAALTESPNRQEAQTGTTGEETPPGEVDLTQQGEQPGTRSPLLFSQAASASNESAT